VGGPPESGGAPYFQTFARTPTFTDTVVSGEGDLGAGPGPGHPNADPDCPGFKFMFESGSTSSRATAGPAQRAARTPIPAGHSATRRRARPPCWRGASKSSGRSYAAPHGWGYPDDRFMCTPHLWYMKKTPWRSGNIPTTSPRADRSCALGVTAIIRSPEPGQKIEIALYGYKLPK
jgi:hypothetical protein